MKPGTASKRADARSRMRWMASAADAVESAASGRRSKSDSVSSESTAGDSSSSACRKRRQRMTRRGNGRGRSVGSVARNAAMLSARFMVEIVGEGSARRAVDMARWGGCAAGVRRVWRLARRDHPGMTVVWGLDVGCCTGKCSLRCYSGVIAHWSQEHGRECESLLSAVHDWRMANYYSKARFLVFSKIKGQSCEVHHKKVPFLQCSRHMADRNL